MFSFILVNFLQLVPVVESYGVYRDKIPNGYKVPHPCKPGQIWNGVGHHLSEGGGSRNPFGHDFKTAGSTWTKELCEKDSDGDGLTNGVELGDSNCTWMEAKYPVKSTPFLCGMSAGLNCRTIIGLWGFGFLGECFHKNVGFRIGSKGYKRVALQMHWNNPSLKTDYMDESGMTIFYTSSRRKSNAGVLMVGPTYLVIPPKTPETVQEGVCPGSCTSRLIKDKIYIVSAINHMHYLGRSEKIEIFRNGSKLRDITNSKYDYDNPKTEDFLEPIEVLPGDTLKTTCYFNSMSKDTVTYYGEATNAEMCFGFITYYPRENVHTETCTSQANFSNCEVVPGNVINYCPLYNYTRLLSRNAYDFITFCYLHCTPDCLKLINDDPCTNGNTKQYLLKFWNYMPLLRGMVKVISKCSPDNVVIPEGWPEDDALNSPSICNVGSHTWFTHPTALSYYSLCDENCTSECLETIKNDSCMSAEYRDIIFLMWNYDEKSRNLVNNISKCMNTSVARGPENTDMTTDATVIYPSSTDARVDVDDDNGADCLSCSLVFFTSLFFILQYNFNILSCLFHVPI